MAIAYNNIGLVKHAENALSLNTKYMWGGILRQITPAYIETVKGIYGTKPGTGYTADRYKYLYTFCGKGYYGVDCVGLIKSYYWSGNENGGVGSIKYSGNTDVNAGTMYNLSKSKGKINTMPEMPGLIVYSKSHPHVGIYIGNGYTIESTLGSRGDGVVKRKLDSFWEYWFECPFITYKQPQKAITVKLLYNAIIRDKPSSQGNQIARLYINNKVTVITGTETKDSVSGYIYIKLYNSTGAEQWIVKSALKL